MGILTIVAEAVMIFGGLQTLHGKDGRIIVIAAGALVVINLIVLFNYFYARGLLSLLIPALIIIFHGAVDDPELAALAQRSQLLIRPGGSARLTRPNQAVSCELLCPSSRRRWLPSSSGRAGCARSPRSDGSPARRETS